MDFALSRPLVPRLQVLDRCTSTNDELLARASDPGATDPWPDLATLVTTNQTGGRGRLGRSWVAPAGEGLAISLLLRPMLPSGEPLSIASYGWLPLIAGIAMTRAVATLVAECSVSLKWPNDVLIDGLKVAGLLAELVPAGPGDVPGSGRALVQGAGLNVAIPREKLPTETSTSLTLHRIVDPHPDLLDAALSAYLTQFTLDYARFLSARGNAEASSILSDLSALCSTIGQPVRVELPGGNHLVGVAVGIDLSGALRVQDADGKVQSVAAGDVTHLRYE